MEEVANLPRELKEETQAGMETVGEAAGEETTHSGVDEQYDHRDIFEQLPAEHEPALVDRTSTVSQLDHLDQEASVDSQGDDELQQENIGNDQRNKQTWNQASSLTESDDGPPSLSPSDDHQAHEPLKLDIEATEEVSRQLTDYGSSDYDIEAAMKESLEYFAQETAARAREWPATSHWDLPFHDSDYPEMQQSILDNLPDAQAEMEKHGPINSPPPRRPSKHSAASSEDYPYMATAFGKLPKSRRPSRETPQWIHDPEINPAITHFTKTDDSKTKWFRRSSQHNYPSETPYTPFEDDIKSAIKNSEETYREECDRRDREEAEAAVDAENIKSGTGVDDDGRNRKLGEVRENEKEGGDEDFPDSVEEDGASYSTKGETGEDHSSGEDVHEPEIVGSSAKTASSRAAQIESPKDAEDEPTIQVIVEYNPEIDAVADDGPFPGDHDESNRHFADDIDNDADQVQTEEEQSDDDEEDELNFGLQVEDDDDIFMKDACKPIVKTPPQDPVDNIQIVIPLSEVPDWLLSGLDEEEYKEHIQAEEQLRNLQIGDKIADSQATLNSQTDNDDEGLVTEAQHSGNGKEEPRWDSEPETIRIYNENYDRVIEASLKTARTEEAIRTLEANAESAGNNDSAETSETSGGTAGEKSLSSTSNITQEQEDQQSDQIDAGDFTDPGDENDYVKAQDDIGSGAEDYDDPPARERNGKPAKIPRKYWKETEKKKRKEHKKLSSKKKAKKDTAKLTANGVVNEVDAVETEVPEIEEDVEDGELQKSLSIEKDDRPSTVSPGGV